MTPNPLSHTQWQRFAKRERDCGRCAFSIPAYRAVNP